METWDTHPRRKNKYAPRDGAPEEWFKIMRSET